MSTRKTPDARPGVARFRHDDKAEDPRGNVPPPSVAFQQWIEDGLREQDILHTIKHVPFTEWSDEVMLEFRRRLLRATDYLDDPAYVEPDDL